MDQNSTNGTGQDKRNWRERLGVGSKDLPRLADEFRGESAQPPAGAAPRAAQPVTRPAPMAPRAPSRPAPPAPAAPAAPAPASRLTETATQEGLAEKLRAQRAAAEKLAEQRVQAARQRAEARTAAEAGAAAQRPAAPPPRAPAPPPAAEPRARASVPPPARPRYGFDDARAERAPGETRPGLGGTPAVLSPPRPALGGERGQPPFLRPAAPPLGARPPSGYRPVEQAGYSGSAPRLQPPPPPPPPPRSGYGAEPPPAYPGARGSMRRGPSLETYPRDGMEAGLDDARPVPRLGRPAARGRGPADDYDGIFEDDAGPRQRGNPRDYQNAYNQDGEEIFAEEGRRSSGPWLLLLALLGGALLMGGAFWYYNQNLGNLAGSGENPGAVPVVNAPEDPAKVAPEAPADAEGQAAGRTKQIYDRIVGEQEILGSAAMQETLEVPADPAEAAQPIGEVQPAEPIENTNQIPAPDQGTAIDTGEDVGEPPPLPVPPPNDQQGSFGSPGSGGQVAAVTGQPEQGATAPPAPAAASSASASIPALPPPDTASEGAVAVSGASDTASASATTAEPAAVALTDPEEEITPPAPKQKPPPPKKKPAKPKEENLGAEPVVLVPPAEPVADTTETASSSPAVEAEPAPAQPRRRSILDLFRAGATGSDDQPAQAERQVAALQEEPAPAPAPAKPARKATEQQPEAGGGSGYVIQLSSFRSEAEARNEYRRLSGLLPGVVGSLPQRISQTSVGGSTRYQLGIGPLPSRNEAKQVCSELFVAGEADCIVKGL